MSSRRGVLIRIALLQRQTLILTQNRTLKCLKHYPTVRPMKNVAVLKGDGEFTHFFRPHPGGSHSLRVPTPGNLPSKAKKNVNARGGGLGAAGIDWCIMCTFFVKITCIIYPNKRMVSLVTLLYFFNRKLSIWPTTTNELHAAVRLATNLLAAPPPTKELQRPLILPATQATKIRKKKTSRTIEAGQENTKEPPCRSYISYNNVLVYVLW